MIEEALDFIRNNKDNPFLLYYATPIPHVSLQVPNEFLNQYKNKFKETPYEGGHYAAHPTPRAAYAAMISYMDHNVGRIMDLLEKLDIKDNTLVLFTSDNGPTFGFGVDYEFFKSNGPLRGLKQDLLEGGIRVPMIASWKDIIKEGSSSDHICAFWDILPTVSEIVDEPIKSKVDGLSILPSLLGQSQKQERHEYLYWESNSQRGRQAVRMGKYKAHRRKLQENPNAPVILYDLEKDLQETTDISSKYPNIVERMKHIMQNARKHSEVFPLFEYNK
jgi:arylsulfatase